MSSNMDHQSKKSNRGEFLRTLSLRLPTPPPDPVQGSKPFDEITNKSNVDKENDFLDYLNSLQVPCKGINEKQNLQRTTSIFAPAIAAENAFDHLDKLYKLMEQLLNLREQNTKLQRRVRDLEHLRNLQSMHQHTTKSVLKGEDPEIPELDDDSVFAEELLDNLFISNRSKRNPKYKSPSQFRFRQSILKPQRDRSCSLAVEDLEAPELRLPRNCSGKSLPESAMLRKPSKVSKWTKVKAAFKWEKASPTVTNAKSQDSGIEGMQPINNEIARYLRVPSCYETTESGASPADSVLSGSSQGVHGISTSGTLSPASSTDDLNPSTISDHRCVSRTESAGNGNPSRIKFRASKTSNEEESDRRSRSVDFTTYACDNPNLINKDEIIKLQANKSHKSPWGKVKDIIQTQKDSLKRKQHRLSTRSDDYKIEYSAGSDQEDVFEPAPLTPLTLCPEVKITTTDETNDQKKPTILQPTNGFTNDEEPKIPPDVLARYRRVVAEEEKCQTKSNAGSPRTQRRVSKWTKVKKAFLTTASISRNDEECRSPPSSPFSKNCHFFTDSPTSEYKRFEISDKSHGKQSEDDLDSTRLKEEIYKNYEQLQKKLSQEFQEKLQEWEKLKTSNTSHTGGQTAPSSPFSEDQRNPEFVRKMEEWEKIKYQNNLENSKRKNLQMTSEENLPADFRKKLQEWQKMKKSGTRDDDSRKKKTDWQLWRSNSGQKQESSVSPQPYEGRQYSDDFLKKLDEWKQIKASHTTTEDQENRKFKKQESKPSSPNLIRKSSSNKLIRQSKKHKMQEWLEKELQKIEREKQRLEREREKFLEREERLAKLRRSIGNGAHKKDVLVQTSTGFFRFEGISRKFTQRLYEWEKARGIGPEDSTIALLRSGYNKILPYPSRINRANVYLSDQRKGTKLTRSKSMDSVANLICDEPLITHQPSSLSLNDMEELEIQCLTESPSERNLNESEDNLDFGEPEAVIVEVEDFVEETAAPLQTRVAESRHTPVYQTEVLNLCESEKCEAPQVRNSKSIKSLSNDNLVQQNLAILDELRKTEEICTSTNIKLTESINANEKKDKEDVKDSAKNKGAIPKRKQINTQTEEPKNSLQDTLTTYYGQQMEKSQSLLEKLIMLQNSHFNVPKNIFSCNTNDTVPQSTNAINQNLNQDLHSMLITTAKELTLLMTARKSGFKLPDKVNVEDSDRKRNLEISELLNSIYIKLKELKRNMSYLSANSDVTTTTLHKRKESYHQTRKNSFHKRASCEQLLSHKQKNISDNTSDEEEYKMVMPKRKERLVKSKSEESQVINYAKLQVSSVGNHRKEHVKRCYQINRPLHLSISSGAKLANAIISRTLDNSEATENYNHKNLIHTNKLSNSTNHTTKNYEEFNAEPNIIIPTNTQYLDATSCRTSTEHLLNSPVSVFVHTTRKLFTPFASEAFNTKKKTTSRDLISEPSNQNKSEISKANIITRRSPSQSPLFPRKTKIVINECAAEENVDINDNPSASHLPPLPSSPIAQRREKPVSKETSPAIRLMIARYNQKLSEQDNAGNKSAGSSGSASPVAWRSPVLERRVKAQTEKYEVEVNKSLQITSSYSPLFLRKQVQKSASVGVIHNAKTQFTLPQNTENQDQKPSPKGILKSTSMGSIKSNQNSHLPPSLPESPTTPSISEDNLKNKPILHERTQKLLKAKEDFLAQTTDSPGSESLPLTPPLYTTSRSNSIRKPPRNRLSQVSVESESSCDSMHCSGLLIKSASAGMINVDEVTYQQFQPEMHSQGYVSLPRASKKKDGKFGISSLTSKFRRVKMRRNKDPTQMNTISTLCRQSLVVDITNTSKESLNKNDASEMEKGSSSSMQSASSKSSWIKNPVRIFKPK